MGASIVESSTWMWFVYHTPARAISNQVQPRATMFSAYHSGYFHWNALSISSMSRECFSGDSPSAKIVSVYTASCAKNSARSPVRRVWRTCRRA